MKLSRFGWVLVMVLQTGFLDVDVWAALLSALLWVSGDEGMSGLSCLQCEKALRPPLSSHLPTTQARATQDALPH
jgi:hypothetical protein